MKGSYYCNGEIPNCPDKEDCYKNGGTCYCTIDEKYAGKQPPNIRELRRRRYGETNEAQNKSSDKDNWIIYECPHQQSNLVTTVIISVISAFATTLIVTLVKTL